MRYHVTSEKDLEIIINHFDKYPLISQKLTDFLLFKQGFELIKTKKPLTLDGLRSASRFALRASQKSRL